MAVPRRAKYLRITIKSDRTVRLTIPEAVAPSKAQQFLKSRVPWIRKHLRKFEALESNREHVRLPRISKVRARTVLIERLKELAELHDFRFNKVSIRNQKSHLGDNAIVIYDSSKCSVDELKGGQYRLIDIPMLQIAVSSGGDPIMRNMVSIGVILKIVGIDISILEKSIRKMFSSKGDVVVNSNIKAATEGYNYKGVEKVYEIEEFINKSMTRYILVLSNSKDINS